MSRPEHNLTFLTEQWGRLADKLEPSAPGMAQEIREGIRHYGDLPRLCFTVSDGERAKIREAAQELGLYAELGIAPPTG